VRNPINIPFVDEHAQTGVIEAIHLHPLPHNTVIIQYQFCTRESFQSKSYDCQNLNLKKKEEKGNHIQATKL